ncbi:flippase [Candidatus Parcubacteria bacterium]|nr:flippase [Candidatus Parcubacteria bacterium]
MSSVGVNASLMMASRVVNTTLSVIAIGLLTRSLGPAHYGDWSIIIAYGTILHAAADWGLAALLSRDLARSGAREGEILRAYGWLRAAAAIAAFAIGITISWFVPFSAAVRLGIAVVSVFFILNSLSQILIAVFQKHLAMHWVAASEVAARSIFLAGVAILGRTHGTVGAAAALIVSGIVQFMFLRWVVRYFAAPAGRPSFGWLKGVWRESWPMAVSISFTLLYFKGDALLLGFMKPREDVAVYGLGYSVLENLIYIPAMFMGLMIPRLTRELHHASAAFRRLLQHLFDLFWMAGVPVMVGLWFASPRIAELLGGPGFQAAAEVMAILGVAILFIFFGNLFGSAVVVLGRQREAMWTYVVGLGVMIAVNLALIPRFSYLGTSWATVVTEFVVTLLLFRVVRRASGFRPAWQRVSRVFTAALVLGFVLWLVRNEGIVTLGLAATASYLAAAWFVGAWTKEDIALFRITAIDRVAVLPPDR